MRPVAAPVRFLILSTPMDVVFDYRIPVLHPLAVHFPLGLLLAGALVALVWMFRGTAFWRRSLLLLLVLGSAGAVFAYVTGEAMEEQSEGVPIVDDLIDLHEQMGRYTLVVAIVACLGVALLSLRQERPRAGGVPARDPIALRLVLGLLVCLAAALVAWTAHIGGTMVWGVPR